MKFEQVCQALNDFLVQKSVMRVLLPLTVPLMFVCVGIQWLGNNICSIPYIKRTGIPFCSA